MGNAADHYSGDLFLAFSTANRQPPGNVSWPASLTSNVVALANRYLDPLFSAAVEATEEAIVNSMLASPTMVSRRRDGARAAGRPTGGADPARRGDRRLAADPRDAYPSAHLRSDHREAGR